METCRLIKGGKSCLSWEQVDIFRRLVAPLLAIFLFLVFPMSVSQLPWFWGCVVDMQVYYSETRDWLKVAMISWLHLSQSQEQLLVYSHSIINIHKMRVRPTFSWVTQAAFIVISSFQQVVFLDWVSHSCQILFMKKSISCQRLPILWVIFRVA